MWQPTPVFLPGESPWTEDLGGLQSMGPQKVQLSHVRLCDTMDCSMPGLPVQSLLKFMSIESVMPSNHLILCCPLLLLPSIFPSIRVFSNESVLYMRWPKYWSFSFSIGPSNEHPGLISFRMDWLDLLAVQGTLKSLPKSINSSVLSFLYSPTLTSIHDLDMTKELDTIKVT